MLSIWVSSFLEPSCRAQMTVNCSHNKQVCRLWVSLSHSSGGVRNTPNCIGMDGQQFWTLLSTRNHHCLGFGLGKHGESIHTRDAWQALTFAREEFWLHGAFQPRTGHASQKRLSWIWSCKYHPFPAIFRPNQWFSSQLYYHCFWLISQCHIAHSYEHIKATTPWRDFGALCWRQEPRRRSEGMDGARG